MATEGILPTNTQRGIEKGEERERERHGERKRIHNPLEALGPALKERGHLGAGALTVISQEGVSKTG